MAMPRLAMPRLSFGSLGALGERTRLLYALYTALLFVVFLVVTFPYEVLVRRLLANVPPEQAVVDIGGARFGWVKGLELDDVKVSGPSGVAKAPYLEVARLWVRPNLSELLRGNPYAGVVEAEIYGGTALGSVVASRDGAVRGSATMSGLSLGRYGFLRSFFDEGTIGGRVSLKLDFESKGRELSKVKSDGQLQLTGGSLEGAKASGFSIPNLHFATAKLEFGLQDEKLEVKEFDAKGTELNIGATGTIGVREPVEASVLNLKATVSAGNEAPDSIKGLLAMMPKGPPGQDQTIKIIGPLAAPKVMPGK